MPTPPTLVSYTEVSSWTSAGTSKSTGTINWNAGDILVVIGGNEGSSTMGVPTATGLTFTRNQNIAGSGSVCAANTSTAVAGSNGSSAVTVTNSASAQFGFGVWVWRNSAGVGTSSQQATTTKTKAQTNTGADSAVMWCAFDFSAQGPVAGGTPTPSNTRQNFDSGTTYSGLLCDLLDQTSAGSVNYGFTGGGASGPFSIVIQEIKAAAASVDRAPRGGSGRIVVPEFHPSYRERQKKYKKMFDFYNSLKKVA